MGIPQYVSAAAHRGLALVAAVAVATLLPMGAALAQQGANVEVVDDAFVPETVEIEAGGTVNWSQTGSNPHTVTDDDGRFDSHPDCNSFADAGAGNCMSSGDTYSQTYDEPGEYPYYCKIHGGAGGAGMSGVVIVQAADTGDDGEEAAPDDGDEEAAPDEGDDTGDDGAATDADDDATAGTTGDDTTDDGEAAADAEGDEADEQPTELAFTGLPDRTDVMWLAPMGLWFVAAGLLLSALARTY